MPWQSICSGWSLRRARSSGSSSSSSSSSNNYTRKIDLAPQRGGGTMQRSLSFQHEATVRVSSNKGLLLFASSASAGWAVMGTQSLSRNSGSYPDPRQLSSPSLLLSCFSGARHGVINMAIRNRPC